MEEKNNEIKLEEENTISEAPKEATVEETKEQPQTVDNLLPGPKPIEKYEKTTSFSNIIEDKRLEFSRIYSRNRKWSYIMMGIVMLVAIGSVICLTQKDFVFNIIGWVLISSAVVGMLVYYIVTRNRMPAFTKDYIKEVSETLNSYTFTEQGVTEAACDDKEKIDLADVIVDGVYVDLNNIASRNVVHARYNGQVFTASDLGLYSGTGKQSKSVFVGKYITFENTLHFKDRFIITIRSKDAKITTNGTDEPIDPPTKVEDLSLQIDEENFSVYGPKDEDIKKIVGTKFLPAIRRISLDNILLNINIVIWAGHSAAYLSYCDEIMTLPFQNVFDGKAQAKYKEDLYAILEAFELLNK